MEQPLSQVRRDALAILTEGVDALADLGSEDAYELLQEVSAAASGSHAAFTGLRRDQAMVDVVGVLLAAHLRAAAIRRLDQRREQLRAAVADVVEAAVRHRDVDDLLGEAVRVLVDRMSCQSATVRAFDNPVSPVSGRRYSASFPGSSERFETEQLLDISARAARLCWEQQTASLLLADEPDIEPLTTAAERDVVLGVMRQVGAREMLMAPLGADGRCQGWIALTRTEVHEPFGEDDIEAALTIGREIGNAVVHARAFEDQQELITRLRELSDHKSWFTAAVVHQLRTPLTSIGLHVDELAASPASSPTRTPAEALGAIARSTHHMEASIEALLALARLQEQDRETAQVEVDLPRVVTEHLEAYAANAQAAGVVLDASAVQADVVVLGDPDDLAMVVDNLIGNAVKYSPDGGRVRIMLTADGSEAVLRCADEGIGMDAHELALVFQPFHRAPDAKRRRIPGTGLGLAIVQAAVERHRGRIDITSAPGSGTTVEVRLTSAPRR